MKFPLITRREYKEDTDTINELFEDTDLELMSLREDVDDLTEVIHQMSESLLTLTEKVYGKSKSKKKADNKKKK
jgi:predicted site-specific integrase-resolvase